MNELDFIDALSDKSLKRKVAAREFLGHVSNMRKSAGAVETAVQFVRQNAPEIGAALAGGALATGAQYLMNRPRGDRPSMQQEAMGDMLAKQKLMEQLAKKQGRELSFKEDLQRATAPSMKETADVLARHPGKGALLAAPAGALISLRILKALKG